MLNITALRCKDGAEISRLLDEYKAALDNLIEHGEEISKTAGAIKPVIRGNTEFGYWMNSVLSDEKPDGPWRLEGNRWDDEHERAINEWVPDARSKAGKKLRAVLSDMRSPGLQVGLGRVLSVENNRMYHAGFDEIGGTYYANYGTILTDEQFEKNVDGKLWERIKVSELALALEAQE